MKNAPRKPFELVDAHCHLDMSPFDDDRDQVLRRAVDQGIHAIIVPGVSAETWTNVHQLCDHNAECYPCYGLHPYWTDRHREQDLNVLKLWLTDNPAVAIGECGLDFRNKQPDRDRQQYFFHAQLDLAGQFDLPIVIHSVHATENVILALKERDGLRGMMHSFSGSYEQAQQLIDMGFYISFGGVITYDRSTRLRDTAGRLPLESLLIETDAPDQPDAAHHNQRNEPSYLLNVLDCLAELRSDSRDRIAEQTTANARRLFDIQAQ
jgi:TatD DNase family protein